ncbi:CheW domain-containing protein [uncultured Paludibaculum sp.]|uniref:chemotaxis protein CheW n=1 Tax=uncultured Paludibaculum sp. TaxID=1765020 RepID=UPI002AAB2824|nr:CheW domain-containing protein [uncultured Paludibaculum sp.]
MPQHVLQVLLCDRQGQSYAVGVEEIASIERDRSALYRTLLVDRVSGHRIAVDRVGGVTEIERTAICEPPARLGRASQGLLGIVDIEGASVPFVTTRFLSTAEPIEIQPEAVSRAIPKDRALPEDTPQLLVTNLRLAKLEFPMPEIVVGIPLEQVLDVSEPLPWVPLTVSGGWVRGVLAWRGQTAQVVDLARCFGLEPQLGAGEERVVIVRGTGRHEPLAFMTSPTLQRVSPSQSTAVSPETVGLRTEAIRGVFRWTNRLLIIPDFDALL